jgi:hypothetical protein
VPESFIAVARAPPTGVAEVVDIAKPSLDLWVFLDVDFLRVVVCSNDLAERNEEVSTNAEAVMRDQVVEACTCITNAGSCGRGSFGTLAWTSLLFLTCWGFGQSFMSSFAFLNRQDRQRARRQPNVAA